MNITNELLDELEQKSKAAGGEPWICIDGDGIDTDHRLITTEARIAGPTVQIATVHYGHPGAGMLEPFQSEQVAAGEHIAAANPATIIALTAHIRSLTERLEKAEKDAARYRWLRDNCQDVADEYGTAGQLYFGTYHAGRLDAAIDAAIAQEGADHE